MHACRKDTILQRNGEKRAEKTVRQQSGDPRYLQTVHRVIEASCKLVGLDVAVDKAGERSVEEFPAQFWDWYLSMLADGRKDTNYIDERLKEAEARALERSGTQEGEIPDHDGQL